MNLFKVQRVLINEYSGSEIQWTKYFMCNSEETLRAVVTNRYGEEKWCNYDRYEVKYKIEKLEVEVL